MMRSAPWLLLSLSVFVVAGCQCRKEAPKPTLLKEGDTCQSDEQCDTGLCDGPPVVGTPKCVRKCSSGCTSAEVCIQFTPNRFACQPDQRRLCQTCTADLDCAYPSDACLAVNGEKVCGRDCAFDQNCPEGYRCVNGLGVDGEAKVQQCVPINASCACLSRGDFLQPCEVTNAFGTCGGIKQCDLVNNVVACDAPLPGADVCNGRDDNCDGKVDEDGGTLTCGVGACQRTVAACAAGGMSAACTPGDAGPELCDAIDNDCDGTVDEDFPVQADVNNCGACGKVCMLPHATPRCEMATCKVDTCDTGWDNCNGMHPDGCEAQLSSDVMNCGMCGRACSTANATPACMSGQCRFTCTAGFVDLDLDPANGCEYACTFASATDVPDLGFVDANCDGIDGELGNGIFVSPAGVDSNPGTRAAPKRTLSAAVAALATNGKRDLYVAAGTYDEPLELLGLSGVNAAGQYDPTTWRRHATSNTTTVRTGNPALKLDAVNNVLVQGFRFEGGDGSAGNTSAYGGWVSESTGVRLEGLFVQAGRGADGTAGASGQLGTSGGMGSAGPAGCVNETRPFSFNVDAQLICAVTEGNCGRPQGGQGGFSGCGFPGGAGGQPSHFDFDIMPVPNGSPGNSAPNGSGFGGQGVPHLTTPAAGTAFFGADGVSGAAGANGAAAAASATFNASGYVLRNGGTGLTGGATGGGTGGATGGGTGGATGGGTGGAGGGSTNTPTGVINLVHFSDWHGQLDPVSETAGSLTTTYAGVGVLSSYFMRERTTNPDLIVVTGGDNIGATPPLSGEFGERPATLGLDFLRLSYTTFGNHEFDRGTGFLRGFVSDGGFEYISTNLNQVTPELGPRVVTNYKLVDVGPGTTKVKVAFLGITNDDAPSLLFPGRLGSITVMASVPAANSAAAAARAAGAHVVVALVHMGATGGDVNNNPTGPLIDFARGLNAGAVDVVLGDHTDRIVNTMINGALVVESRSKGRTYSRVAVTVTNGAVTARTAAIVDPIATQTLTIAPLCSLDGGAMLRDGGAAGTCPNDAGWTCGTPGICNLTVMTPDPAWEPIIAPYRAQITARYDEKIGTLLQIFPRNGSVERTVETPTGDLIADAMLDRYRPLGASIAFTNSGGIRAALPSYPVVQDGGYSRTVPPIDLVKGDPFTVLPFGNTCVVRTINGSTLWSALEHSVSLLPGPSGRFLAVAGMRYEFRPSLDAGTRVQRVQVLWPDGGFLDVPRDAGYSLGMVTNDFTNSGGDNYTMLVEPIASPAREVLADVVLDYIRARTPISYATVDGGLSLPDGGFSANRAVSLP